MDKTAFFIFNLFINSVLTFLTVALLIEGLILLFRIRQGRLAAALRVVPFLKLPLDLFLYNFSTWAYAQGINPLHCPEGTRTLSIAFGYMRPITEWPFLPFLSKIELTVPGNRTFTIADLMGNCLGPTTVTVCSLLLLMLCFWMGISSWILSQRVRLALEKLNASSSPSRRKVTLPTLERRLQRHRVDIRFSPVASPFIAGLLTPILYIPPTLSNQLSDGEYMALLAHEAEHARYGDALLRWLLRGITTVFWWVPAQWLYRRIAEGQEMACDRACRNYGADPLDLASAIGKSMRHALHFRDPFSISSPQFAKDTVHRRLHALLEPSSSQFSKRCPIRALLASGIALLIVLPGKFWIF